MISPKKTGLNAILTKFSICSPVVFLVSFPDIWVLAQPTQDQIEITDSGIMAWRDSGKEVTGFGVNYTVPFAHAFRMGKKKGIDLKAAIDQDIYQFSRLGFDLYRIHVWDCEISDTLGNLLDNEHLELFDYLLFQLKAHKINSVITPIAYWGNGWPEPDEDTPGFSSKYGKEGCLVNPDAIEAQYRYLSQFARHKNRYTGVAYKDESSILAFEISNEPHHRAEPRDVRLFIEKMKDAITSTGCTKPVFYNVTHSVHLAHSYFEAGIDGGTFQWYPTGLGFLKELGGNMLPNVDRYLIPFADVMEQYRAARLVYEFDAADMASTYMYPAMARSFRTAGMQLGTHFAYDPTFLSPFNTEYNTHFMNLFYAPRKALSLMICGEVFRQIPLYEQYGNYPANTHFGPFYVSYENDLAEMVTDEKFYYTNHTTTRPPSPEKLKHIAGWGHSPVISYEGTGAYFLDQIIPGMWLLEVYPDAVQTDNLFGKNSPEKIRAVLHHQEWPIRIELPEFENGVFIGNIKSGDTKEYSRAEFGVMPGVYLISTPEVILDNKGFIKAYQHLDSLKPDRFYTHLVSSTLTGSYISPATPPVVSVGADLNIGCTVVTALPADSVCIWYYEGRKPRQMRMHREHGYSYTVTIPADVAREGRFPYYITVYTTNDHRTYPSGMSSKPGSWDFDAGQAYHVDVVPASRPLYLFNAGTDIDRLNRDWLPEARHATGDEEGKDYLYLKMEKLQHTDPENPYGTKAADYSLRHYFGDKLKGRRPEFSACERLVLDAYVPEKTNCPVQVKLVMKDGSAFGKIIHIKAGKKIHPVELKEFEKVSAVLLPRPYPTFLPYFSAAGAAHAMDMTQIESLQLAIGPGMKANEVNAPHEVYIGRVWLE